MRVLFIALELYQAGSEGPQWWEKYPDAVRGLPSNGILVRCRQTGTCPKVVEARLRSGR